MAFNQLTPLSWDTDFLGYPVYRLNARALGTAELQARLTEARAAGARLVYVFADPDDAEVNAAASAAGLPLVDRKVTYAMAATVPTDPLNVVALRPATGPTPALENLVLQSGVYSRFKLDPNFAPGVYEELYTRWLHNSFNEGLAREILVFQETTTSEPLGLLTLGIKNDRADIGLLAVDEQVRGRRLGQQLVLAARHLAAYWQLPILQVVTQGGNEPACRFYERCGFRPDRVEHIYHAWL